MGGGVISWFLGDPSAADRPDRRPPCLTWLIKVQRWNRQHEALNVANNTVWKSDTLVEIPSIRISNVSNWSNNRSKVGHRLNPRDSDRKLIPNIYLLMKCRNVIIETVPRYVGDPFMNPWEFKDPSNPKTKSQTDSTCLHSGLPVDMNHLCDDIMISTDTRSLSLSVWL